MPKKYKNNSNNKWPGLFEALAEIIMAIGILLGKLIYKLIRLIFQTVKGTRPSYRLQETHTRASAIQINTPIETPIQVNNESRYTIKQSLLTDAEKEFLQILKQIVGDRYHIESQVKLSGIVKPTDSNQHYTNYHDLNRIDKKSIDFVLYDKEYRPYLAIELDDRSHQRWDRIERDQFVNEIMSAVGLRIIHVPTSYSYNIEALKKQVFLES